MLLGLAVALALVAALLAAQVDDWRRDLTTNHAATSVDASDASLRTLYIEASIEDLDAAVAAYAKGHDRWTLVAARTDGEYALFKLERRTRWLGFVDDVQVCATHEEGVCKLDATSASRIGKGDLGQNPRNLREILGAIGSEFPDASPPAGGAASEGNPLNIANEN